MGAKFAFTRGRRDYVRRVVEPVYEPRRATRVMKKRNGIYSSHFPRSFCPFYSLALSITLYLHVLSVGTKSHGLTSSQTKATQHGS